MLKTIKADKLKDFCQINVEGLENYLIDKNGNVYSKYYKCLLKQQLNHKGYFRVRLKQKGYSKRNRYFFIHRLVALTFIPNPDNLPQVNHKDENKLNNNINNLEWCDNKYNANYGTSITRRLEKVIGRKTTEETKEKIKLSQPKRIKINQYTLNGDFIRSYDSINDTKKYGLVPSCVRRVVVNERKKYKNFIFRRTENELCNDNN
jgi:hypothetical protein